MSDPRTWSPEAQHALAVGLTRLHAAMKDAGKRVQLARDCNGAADCTSRHHLTCCVKSWRREADA
jgi:hypothetical protein